MKLKSYHIPIIVILLIAVVFISGCVQTPESTTTTQPSKTPETTPQQTQSQEPECTPEWQCTGWSECSASGTQTRTCTDKNNCGVTTGKPAESQSCTPPIVEPEPITLSGSGQEASDIFELIEGVAIFELENTGSGHFGIWLMDDMGNNVELLVNEIGPFDGSKIVRIDREGEYILDVSAQGSWEVTIKQPRPTTAPETKTFSGKDQQYAGPFYLDSGLTKFKLKNTGSGHFGIWLLDSEGNNVELLVNEIGPFDGSKAVGIRREGIYYFDISAQGNWEITIE